MTHLALGIGGENQAPSLVGGLLAGPAIDLLDDDGKEGRGVCESLRTDVRDVLIVRHKSLSLLVV